MIKTAQKDVFVNSVHDQLSDESVTQFYPELIITTGKDCLLKIEPPCTT